VLSGGLALPGVSGFIPDLLRVRIAWAGGVAPPRCQSRLAGGRAIGRVRVHLPQQVSHAPKPKPGLSRSRRHAEAVQPAGVVHLAGSLASSIQGRRLRALVCLGRTTVKWRRSRVATSVRFSRSAMAMTEASTAPSGRSA
jgi:hypothetical protein